MDKFESTQGWMMSEPGRLIGKGHCAGDFLEAYEWRVLDQFPGYLRVHANLPDRVMNPIGQLFGGFAPTYIDVMTFSTLRAGKGRSEFWKEWMATSNMRIDYFEPVVQPHVIIESKLVKRRRRLSFVETRFLDDDGQLLIFGLTTMLDVPSANMSGDD